MMAYIQKLAFVLCSFFLQDAFSVGHEGIQRIGQKNANYQVFRTESSESSPSPSEEYPNLTAVKNMFWNTFEKINQDSENGKLNIRAARNAMSNVLSDELFWSSLVNLMKKRAIVTFDSERADRKIQKCNMFTTTITSPIAIQGFEDIANELFTTVLSMKSNVGTNAIHLITDMVDGGSVTRGLDTITDIVDQVDCCPRKLIDGFNYLHQMLKMGGITKMRGGMAKGLMAFASNFK